MGIIWIFQEMSAFNLTVLLTKSYCVILRFRSKKGESTHSSEAEEKLIPKDSDLATVFASILFFNNRSSFFSFSNVFIFLTLRRIISSSRFLKKACCFSRRFIFIKISDNDARVARNLLLMRECSFSILAKSDKKISTVLYLISRRT